MAFHEFGVGMTGTERISGAQAGAARDFVSGHRNEIAAAAKDYRIDALVLANVLYQERRHAGVDDYMQDRNPEKYPNATLGPGQMNVSTFKGLVEKGAVHLSADERRQYASDSDGFSRKYLIDPKTGIEATAALISDRLQVLQNHSLIPRLRNDGDPNTLSVGQFVYGAALYSAGGRVDGGGKSEFDRKGPTTDQIDFKNNNLFGMVGTVKQDEKIITAFHYLPDTYEAYYGKPSPDRLGGYFHDRSVLRDTHRSSVDAPPGQGTTGIATTASAFGSEGQPGHALFKSIAGQVAQADIGLDAQQRLNLSGALTARAAEIGLSPQLTVSVNANGRVFAHEQGEAGRVAFVDASVAAGQPLDDSAAKTRQLAATSSPPDQPQQHAPARGPSLA